MSIKTENLTHIYMKGTPYEKKALDSISIEISKGEFVGIIGHTGSGKSTLVQHFNGLLKPTSGKIYLNGSELSGANLKELRKQVGIIFQYPEHQLFEETVYKDVAFGLAKMNLNSVEIEKRVLDAIKTVGLNNEVLEKSPFELSGGQKRRVAIAGVIAMEPDILILDEPTAGLDPRGRDEVFDFINRHYQDKKSTIILVSHSMEDVARLVKRVIVMHDGRVDMDGDTESIFSEPDRLESIGLGVPQVTYLMKRLKKVVPDINDRIFTVEEAKIEIAKFLNKKC